MPNNTRFRSGGNSENLRTQFNALRADVVELRTQLIALLTKMDADFADVSNASVDYVSSVSPDAITSEDLTP